MRRFKLAMTSVAVLTTLMLLSASFVYAEGDPVQSVDQTDITAEKILADVFVLRPLGIVATAFGAAMFLVTLPITLPLNNQDVVAKKLVGNAWDYTFKRPVGQVK
jgi:hypothetical protein